MDALSAAIRDLLNDPQSAAQIQSLAQSLGLGDTPGTPPAAEVKPEDPTGQMMSAIMQAAPLLTAASKEDDAARLLAALRPFLGEVRQKKLDEAGRLLKLLRLLPLLRESGVLQNIL